MKRVTFITTGQPSTNPRLVKEVNSLIKFGYEVKVVYCYYQEWASKYDLEFFAEHPNTYFICGGDPKKNRFIYLMFRIRFKMANILSKWTLKFSLAESAISRTHLNALKIAKSIKTDIYIAHNLGALPAAILAAKNQNCKVGYDAEDMHSAQFGNLKSQGYLLNKFIEERYFPQVDYFTAASPLIAKNYKIEYPYLKPILLNNVFPKTNPHIKPKEDTVKPIKLFWFSQTIGKDRGLEGVIAALLQLKKEFFELHLLGKLSSGDREYFLDQLNGKDINIYFYEPVAPSELIDFASQFDIGLATELSFPKNRDICLTNKIFTYVQAGLAIVASNTSGQNNFMKEYPNMGFIFDLKNFQSLVSILNQYGENQALINQQQLQAIMYAQETLNWEYEEPLFISTVEKALNS